LREQRTEAAGSGERFDAGAELVEVTPGDL
jgi:hypothetical protein